MSAPNIAAATAKLYKHRYGQTLPTTALTTFLVNDSASGKVLTIESALFVALSTSTSTTVNLHLIKSGGGQIPLVPPSTAISNQQITAVARDTPVHMEEGDCLAASAGAASQAVLLVNTGEYQES